MTAPAAGGKAEVHLFVLWQNARPWANQIIADIETTFRILDAIELRWTPDRAPRHYTRLYAQPLPPGSQKVLDCGMGFPLILVVSDDSPVYGRRRKWGTTYTVNTHLFDAKRRYRGLTGKSSVHCSTDLVERDHDLFMLLGLRSGDYADPSRARWDRSVRPVERDLTGDLGWASLEEMLTAVDLTLRYVRLPDVGADTNVRLLVSSLCERCGLEWLLSDPERFGPGDGPGRFPVSIGGDQIRVETITVGDGHHARQWQAQMLERRVRGSDGAYVLSADDASLELAHEVLARGAQPPPGFDPDDARARLARAMTDGENDAGVAARDGDESDPPMPFALVERFRLYFRRSAVSDWLWIRRNR